MMNTLFQQRSEQPELMDDLQSSGPVIPQTLRELNTINTWLGGDHVTINGLKKITKNYPKDKPLHIMDIGCGGGDILKKVCHWSRKDGRKIRLTGIDANPNIIEYASKNTSNYNEIDYSACNILTEEFENKQCDIITATLFTHHFTSDQLVKLFRQFARQARLGIIINDLHRHWFAYHSIKALTALFSRSDMVRNDASLSVLRSFSKNELIQILNQSGLRHYTIKWFWAFRWQIIAYT